MNYLSPACLGYAGHSWVLPVPRECISSTHAPVCRPWTADQVMQGRRKKKWGYRLSPDIAVSLNNFCKLWSHGLPDDLWLLSSQVWLCQLQGSWTLFFLHHFPWAIWKVCQKMKNDSEAKAWMQKNFIECKEKDVVHREHKEQPLRCSGARAGGPSAHPKEEERQTGPPPWGHMDSTERRWNIRRKKSS